jgi:hypothetical protein
LLDNIPMGAVFSERRAKVRLIFHCGSVMKSGHFQAEGLAATACT